MFFDDQAKVWPCGSLLKRGTNSPSFNPMQRLRSKVEVREGRGLSWKHWHEAERMPSGLMVRSRVVVMKDIVSFSNSEERKRKC